MDDFWWDAEAGQYRDARGRFISRVRIRRILDLALADVAQRFRGHTNALRTGKLSLEDWRTLMRQDMKLVHLWSTALARGGWAQLTPSDYGRAGNLLRRQYQYLEGFVDDLASGRVIDGRAVRRSALYAVAGRDTYHRTERLVMRDLGYMQERNILGDADHCAGCIEATEQGWVDLGTLRPIGTRDCLTNCKCYLEYRKVKVTSA